MAHDSTAKTRQRDRQAPTRLAQSELARLTFLGAAGEVTGSCFLLETRRSRVLFECGLFQGGKEARAKNREPFELEPAALDAVVLTHAHIDHSGLLPRLVKDGYEGPVDCTEGTAELCGILLRDSAFLQEQEAARRSKRRLRKGREPLAPLYTVADAERAIARLRPRRTGERFELTGDVSLRLRYAGHILGAASLELWIRDEKAERKLVLSGDLGRDEAPLLAPPDPPEEAELVVMESTYGEREHRDMAATLEELAEILVAAARDKAKVIVPAFAVGRSQELLHAIGGLEREGRVPARRVVLDSPMAIRVTELHQRFERRDHPATAGEEGVDLLEPAHLELARDWQESMALNYEQDLVVLSASGMCEGGRVLHHLKHNLWRSGTHLVFAGFQAQGTLGRALVDGAKRVKVMGEEIAVKAKVHTLGGFSAHADRRELCAWLRRIQGVRAVALIHGEPPAREALARRLRDEGGRQPLLPERGQALVIPRSGDAFRLE